MTINSKQDNKHDLLKMILLLAGSFMFAFLCGEMVHEIGHYLAHRIYGNTGAKIILNPFGYSHMEGVQIQSAGIMAVTAAAGPLFNVWMGCLSFMLFRSKIATRWLPYILWGPVALIQEGVTFTFGFLTPGGDAQWISQAGVPVFVIAGVGILFLCTGLVIIAALLPQIGLRREDGFWRKFMVVFVGMVSLMLLRMFYTVFVAPAALVENAVPLILSVLLALVVVLLHSAFTRRIGKKTLRSGVATWSDAYVAFIMGAGILVFQIIVLN